MENLKQSSYRSSLAFLLSHQSHSFFDILSSASGVNFSMHFPKSLLSQDWVDWAELQHFDFWDPLWWAKEESVSKDYEIRANQLSDSFFQMPTGEIGLILIIHQYELEVR